jgi:hypothetical protein
MCHKNIALMYHSKFQGKFVMDMEADMVDMEVDMVGMEADMVDMVVDTEVVLEDLEGSK